MFDYKVSSLLCRQRQLEDALLYHGMFHDAVQALVDWLNSVEPSLSTETAVMGDVETVKLLIHHHKVSLTVTPGG